MPLIAQTRELRWRSRPSPQPQALRESLADLRRRAAFVIFTCFALAVALLFLWQARSILLLLFAGYIGALLLVMLTAKFQSWFHVRRRGLAAAP